MLPLCRLSLRRLLQIIRLYASGISQSSFDVAMNEAMIADISQAGILLTCDI